MFVQSRAEPLFTDLWCTGRLMHLFCIGKVTTKERLYFGHIFGYQFSLFCFFSTMCFASLYPNFLVKMNIKFLLKMSDSFIWKKSCSPVSLKAITITTYNVEGQTQGCKAKSQTGFGLCVVWYTNSLWDFIIFNICWKRTNSKRITVTYMNPYVESILACHYKHNGNFRWEDLRCYSPSNNFINSAHWGP